MDFEPDSLDTILVQQDVDQRRHYGSSIPLKGHRACLECRRKKTKCDMSLPVCGLCRRTGGCCTFPTKRKSPTFKRPHNRKRQSVDPERLERLVDLLESRLSDGNQEFDDLSPRSLERRPSVISHQMDSPMDVPPSHTPSSEGNDREQADHRGISPPRTPPRKATDSQPLMSCPQASNCRAEWLSIPEQTAIELIHLYFDKTQPWLPLLHRPNFFTTYVGNNMSRFHDSNNFSDQDALLIHGMLALAARHSSNACLAEIPAPDRADQFVKEATALYGKLRGAEEPPSIKYLQGCVLLAVNLAAAGPCHRTWILTGVCVRMAYDLDLCNMDDGGDTWEDAAEWVAMEERRRLFWIVWELDSFVSAITRRPSAINRQRVAVLLPSSDEAWFAQDPVKSSLLGTRPSEAWKSLVDSPNQDERAWFLIANYLMAVAYEMKTNQRTHQADRDELIDALTCFNIVITQRFSLENHVGLFDLNDFTKYNWIIGMHLMLTSARTCVSTFEDNPQASVLAYSREFCRIIHHWHPETVILSHPFLACILLTPQATLANTAVTELINTTSSNLEMTLLMLDQYGSVWKLASVLRDIVHLLKRRDSLSEQEVLLAKRFLIFFPALARRHKPASKVVSQANGEDRTHEGNGNSDELSFDQSLETLELSKQLDEQEAQLAVAHDFDTEELNVMTHFRLDVPDDWSSQIQFDNVCDDNQHFNYLQL